MRTPLMLAIAAIAAAGRADPGAPGGPNSVSTETGGSRSVATVTPARRARPPRERRKEGNIPGIVTIPYGKTASGERTHIYRIMGQGGVVADFTDYGARLVRLYTPDATADLANILEGFKPSVIDCEKSGDLSEVWQMTPIRRPRATGLVFELGGSGDPKPVESNNSSPRITYWLGADNTLSVESSIADTNAVKWASQVTIAPLKGRSLAVADSLGSRTYASTTNSVALLLRPGTNIVEKVTLRFSPAGAR